MTESKVKLNVEQFNNQVNNSAFRRSAYRVDIGFMGFLKNISVFTHSGWESDQGMSDADQFDQVIVKNPDKIFECVPNFQRDNDKWSLEMQQRYIENILRGYKSTLMFYEVVYADGLPLRCELKIIDGLQRLTAIHGFFTGQVRPFGWSYKEIKSNNLLRLSMLTIKIEAYSFKNEIEAVEFYIEINENITHSNMDILRAKAYLADLKKKRDCDLVGE